MAVTGEHLSINWLVAGEDMTDWQFRCVTLNQTTGMLTKPTANINFIVGILQEPTPKGHPAHVVILGVTKAWVQGGVPEAGGLLEIFYSGSSPSNGMLEKSTTDNANNSHNVGRSISIIKQTGAGIHPVLITAAGFENN